MLRVASYMNVHQQIEADLRSALKSADMEKAGALRFLISAVRNYQIEKKAKDKEFLPDSDVIAVLRRQVKQRKDSITEYEKGGRADLAEKEKKELEILESYLPAGISEEKIREVVRAKMSKLGITEKSGFGRLMGETMKELKGQADGDAVKKIVEEELGQIKK